MKLISFAAALLLALPVAAAEVPMGDDGLHKPSWLQDTFKNLPDDLAEANAQGKRMVIMIEQRGCIYCKKMQEDVFPDPAIDKLIREHFFVDQVNLYGDTEVTDFDGKVLSEKDMAARWGVVFTPTIIFLPEKVPEGKTAMQAAVQMMPGAFGKGTTKAMLMYVMDHGYETSEGFQRYMNRVLAPDEAH